jgi:hypothetical protein
VPDLPPIVPAVLDTLLSKSQDSRYDKATQVLEDLQAFKLGKTPTHLTMLRKKRGDMTVYEVVPAGDNMLVSAKGQSLVADLMLDAESSISAPVVIPRTGPSSSTWITFLWGGPGLALLAIVVTAIAVNFFGNLDSEELPASHVAIPPGAEQNQEHPPPPPDQNDHRRGYDPQGNRVHGDEYYGSDGMMLTDQEWRAKGLRPPRPANGPRPDGPPPGGQGPDGRRPPPPQGQRPPQ